MIDLILKSAITNERMLRRKVSQVPRNGDYIKRGENIYVVTQVEWDYTTATARVTVWVANR